MFVSYRRIGLLGTYPTIPEGEYFYLIFLILTRKVWIIFLSNISNNSFSLFILFFACMLSCVQLYVPMTDSLQLHELQHARLLCPSLFPRVCSNSWPLSRWCYLNISSSATPFSSCSQFFSASRSFLKCQLFASGDQSTGASAHQSFQWIFRVDFL